MTTITKSEIKKAIASGEHVVLKRNYTLSGDPQRSVRVAGKKVQCGPRVFQAIAEMAYVIGTVKVGEYVGLRCETYIFN